MEPFEAVKGFPGNKMVQKPEEKRQDHQSDQNDSKSGMHKCLSVTKVNAAEPIVMNRCRRSTPPNYRPSKCLNVSSRPGVRKRYPEDSSFSGTAFVLERTISLPI